MYFNLFSIRSAVERLADTTGDIHAVIYLSYKVIGDSLFENKLYSDDGSSFKHLWRHKKEEIDSENFIVFVRSSSKYRTISYNPLFKFTLYPL